MQQHSYDYDGDQDFQRGLHVVLRNASSKQEREQAVQQAKAFYYERVVKTRASHGDNDARSPASFQEVMALMLAGKSVPGIKEVPDNVLSVETQHGTTLKPRKKPWEKSELASVGGEQ